MYREAFLAAPQALLAVDADRVVRLVNRAAERVLRRPAAGVVGGPLTTVLATDPDTGSRRLRLPDGSALAVSVRTAAIAPEGVRADGWTVLAIEDRALPSRAALEDRVQVLAEAEREQEFLLSDLILAQERERARIAAGVHDDSLQVITAAMLRVQQLRRRLRDSEALDMLTRIEESISMAADRLRRLIFDYRPPALERSGLAAAVQDALSRMSDDTGIQVRLENAMAAEPPLPARLLLYRITKEALDNATTHAAARRVDVTLADDSAGYLIRVSDDGVGIPDGDWRAVPRPGHLGLVLMRERAEFAGGWFRLESMPGLGTTISVWVPRGADVDAPPRPPALRR